MLAFRGAWTHRSTGHRRAGAGETRVAFPVPARTGVPAHFGMPGLSGRGDRPCHSVPLILGQPGAKAPGQRPPGRALACVVPGPAGLWGSVPRGRGKRAAFPGPARRGEGTSTASMAGAIAPATAPRWDQDQPGAKAPGQRPPRPRREPPCVAIVAAVLAGPWSLTGRGDAVRFPSARNGRHPSDGSE